MKLHRFVDFQSIANTEAKKIVKEGLREGIAGKNLVRVCEAATVATEEIAAEFLDAGWGAEKPEAPRKPRALARAKAPRPVSRFFAVLEKDAGEDAAEGN